MVDRITEPYLKARLCLWLVEQGATYIQVSVDGAEPKPEGLRQELIEQGWTHTPLTRSSAAWTGGYRHPSGTCEIEVVCSPALDMIANVGTKVWVSECKGEPTAKGISAGSDLTNTYAALGQLLINGGAHSPYPSRLLLGIAASSRMENFIAAAACNPLVCQANITIVLVSHDGSVREM